MKTIKTDVLIIGSGVAAASMSQRMLDNNPNRAILILEAGARVKMKDFALFQNYVASNQSNSGLPYAQNWDYPYPEPDTSIGENQSTGDWMIPMMGSRLMMYGGSTVHWGGWSFRRKPEDFQLYTNTGKGKDWPITYDELENYYSQAECYIGVSGDSKNAEVPRKPDQPYPYPAFPYTLEDGPVIEAFTKLRYAYSHMPIARHGVTSNTDSPHAPCQTTGTCKYCPFGARYVAANYIDDMKAYNNYPNLVIMENMVVKNLVMASKKVAAGATVYNKATGETVNVQAEIVVVAGGAIESPKLLLNSADSSYWKNGVGNDHDLVGRNYITHPYFMIQATLPSNPKKLQPENGFPTWVSRHFDSREEQEKGKFLLVNINTAPSVNLASMMQAGMSKKDMMKAINGESASKPLQWQIHGQVEVFTEFTNYVKPTSSPNHIGLPQTLVHYDKPAGFDERMAYITNIVKGAYDEMGATGTTLLPVSWRADHSSCTTPMANTPEQGVVDRDLKVFGTDNLYVCSNASFSSLGAVNPTLTLTALSLRLGDLLSK